jgi:hypothetical protein
LGSIKGGEFGHMSDWHLLDYLFLTTMNVTTTTTTTTTAATTTTDAF